MRRSQSAAPLLLSTAGKLLLLEENMVPAHLLPYSLRTEHYLACWRQVENRKVKPNVCHQLVVQWELRIWKTPALWTKYKKMDNYVTCCQLLWLTQHVWNKLILMIGQRFQKYLHVVTGNLTLDKALEVSPDGWSGCLNIWKLHSQVK